MRGFRWLLCYLSCIGAMLPLSLVAKRGQEQCNPPTQYVAVQDSPVIRTFWGILGNQPLDKAFLKCLEDNEPGDYGERLCLYESLAYWEKELALSYKLLYQYCSRGPSGKKLKTAQRQWEKFRKAEFTFIEGQYQGLEGTMYERFTTQQKLLIVRERAILLGNYYLQLKADRD